MVGHTLRTDIPVPKGSNRKGERGLKQVQNFKSNCGRDPAPMALVCPIHSALLDSIDFTAFVGWNCRLEGVLGYKNMVALPAWGQEDEPTLKASLIIAQIKLSMLWASCH